jgi:N-acetylglucosaminyl-diphospho-decaprenol L-rhamnosyltransferase
MDLSIVIVSWNTREILAGCLHSVFVSETSRQFEVLVVDNASTDGSGDMIREAYPQTRLFSNQENVGFARANNQAIACSSGKYVMLLNPDTVVDNTVVEVLSDYLDRHPDVGAVGPRLLNPDRTLQQSAFPKPTLAREFWRMFHLDRIHNFAEYPMQDWPITKPRDVDVLMGACLIVRRKVLDQIGFLDESFFIYSEEVDLCTRIRNFGWRIIWVPTVAVEHLGGQSTEQIQSEMFLQLYRGKIQYFRKHHSTLEVWLYKLVLIIATLARLALIPFAYLERSTKKNEHLKLSSNYRRLLCTLPGL